MKFRVGYTAWFYVWHAFLIFFLCLLWWKISTMSMVGFLSTLAFGFGVAGLSRRTIDREYRRYVLTNGEAPYGPGAMYYLYMWPSIIYMVGMAGCLATMTAVLICSSPFYNPWWSRLLFLPFAVAGVWLRIHRDPYLHPRTETATA